MARLQGGQDAFEPGQRVVGVEGLGVGDALVADPAAVFPVAVLGADAGIVETGRDRVHVLGLAVVVLEHVAEAAVQHARLALGQAGGMVAGLQPPSAGLGADQLDLGVLDERIEHARRVRSRRRRRRRPCRAAGRAAPGTAGGSRGR